MASDKTSQALVATDPSPKAMSNVEDKELAAHTTYSSLEFTEAELTEHPFDPNNPDHVEIAKGLTPEQIANATSRERRLEKLPWDKFNRKLADRGILEEHANRLGIPWGFHKISYSEYYNQSIAFFQAKAPDLVDEFKAILRYQGERQEQRAKEELQKDAKH
ncbi:MAG: hypothetical protein Q9187_001728 [Circinaria calcarea]